jgi:hypothetical protein
MDREDALSLISSAFMNLNDINYGEYLNRSKRKLELNLIECTKNKLKSAMKTPYKKK